MEQLKTLALFYGNNPPSLATVGASIGTTTKGWQITQMYQSLEAKRMAQLKISQQQHEVKIPRIIWLYWETLAGRTKPPYLDACLQSILRWNSPSSSHYPVVVRVVCPQNIHEFLTPDELHPAWQRIGKVEQKADYLRVLLLARHGGVWMDMDTICFGSIVPFLERLGREHRDLVLWQRDWSFEVNNALIFVTPQHPVMVDALTRMHTRFDAAPHVHFENWTELGSMLYGDCVHAYLAQQHELSDSGHPPSSYIELRNMAEIEPFTWIDAHEWTMSRQHPSATTDAWLTRHIRSKEAHSDTLVPVLSFPNALISTDYKKQFATVEQLLAAPPHYLSLALRCALCSPRERNAAQQPNKENSSFAAWHKKQQRHS